MRAVRQAVPHGVQEPEVLLRVVRERGAKGREINAMRSALAEGRCV